METWDRSRLVELVSITDAALPAENLTGDELLASCWEGGEPSIVLALDGGEGVIAGVQRNVNGRWVAYVQVIAVRPEARRLGHGRALVEALAAWAFADGEVTSLAVGGGGPFYLWPGVDVHATAALCLFESTGFRPVGAELNLSFSSRHQRPPVGSSPAAEAAPPFEIRRVLDDADSVRVLGFVERNWPGWRAEAARAVEHGSCHMAVADDDAVVGFACHSVNRLGWLGPMGTDVSRRSTGVGRALLAAIAADLRGAGIESVEVSWVGPIGFYAKAAGATVSRAFRTLRLDRPGEISR